MVWFESFRDNGAPTYFYRNIHEPLNINIRTLIIFFLFLVPYICFIVILPGLREKRISSFITLTYHLGIGALLATSLVLPYWNVGSARIVSQFTPSSLQHEADLGISVGLKAINVSLKYVRTVTNKSSEEFMFRGMYFNERYTMDGVNAMGVELREAYDQGMPYPFLKVLEYFTLNAGSFCWGREYRKAGYFANSLLWTGFAFWVLQSLLVILLPHQYGKAGLLTGCFILLGVLVYIILGPEKLHIPFSGHNGQKVYLIMHYGSSFYLALVSGVLSVVVSFVICVLQHFRVYTLNTVFSSLLDDTVGPRCKWGSEGEKERVVSSVCSDISYMSEERGLTPPPPFNRTAPEFTQFPQQSITIITDETKGVVHVKQSSHDSDNTTATQSTKSTTDLRSLESSDRFDSIGTIDHLDDVDLSPAFSRRHFTLPLTR